MAATSSQSSTSISASNFDAPSFSFNTRRYPPAGLNGIPRSFELAALRTLSRKRDMFNSAVQSDCTVVIPYEGVEHLINRDPYIAMLSNESHRLDGPRPLAYRANEGETGVLYQLHIDFLASFSKLFRALFAGMTIRDYAANTLVQWMRRHGHPTVTVHDIAPRLADMRPWEGRVPQLLAGETPDEARVFLPLPDPASFHYIAHWMYTGRIDLIVKALCAGRITWHGLARNGSALGMTDEYQVMLRDVRAYWAVRLADKPDDWSESDETDSEDAAAFATSEDEDDVGVDVDMHEDESDAQADDEDEELGFGRVSAPRL
ncbi:hypothetical protein K488DRAFT_87415 [Vararia minispora EC-137]|uniref:Uncharacterized protein n=1 Tax=Vararia minispora EC-137 TaxID=1314806 RepID=A0ACB8QGW4_9AGAM|nr:hypothetical protein K488DRAFT_87415 [Vararia minispora EC-137]